MEINVRGYSLVIFILYAKLAFWTPLDRYRTWEEMESLQIVQMVSLTNPKLLFNRSYNTIFENIINCIKQIQNHLYTIQNSRIHENVFKIH